jgi:hypothetical protein
MYDFGTNPGRTMMSRRRTLPKAVVASILIASRRRCCLCVSLKENNKQCRGQIAHLNHDPSDRRSENLAYLCLEHHDEYDSHPRLSKSLTAAEVKVYRDRLYDQHDPSGKWRVMQGKPLAISDFCSAEEPISQYEIVRANFSDALDFTTVPWRFPLYQVANEPEYFAYKAGNRADGVCLIERINLPDGRIVIACIETAGNPGCSITNTVEELCFQVCERFEIPPDKVVWLEHYDYINEDEWSMVTFGHVPPKRPFSDPTWVDMTPKLWQDLRLKPKRKLKHQRRDLRSKLTKLFPWPSEALV